jgi:hypothetical protein
MPQEIFGFHERQRARREESSLPQVQKHTSRAAIELLLRGYIQEKLKGTRLKGDRAPQTETQLKPNAVHFRFEDVKCTQKAAADCTDSSDFIKNSRR